MVSRKEERIVKVGKRSLTLTNESRILFPKSRITKGDLISYYAAIAPVMLPYIKNHLITMVRYPSGIDEEGFYQKDAGTYFPDWITTQRVKKEGGFVDYVVCNDAATLIYLANLACITPHIWLSQYTKLDYPDRMIFDLDPSQGVTFSAVRKAALVLHEILQDLGLHSFVMTTGSRGLHVVVPLKRLAPFEYVREFARDVAQWMVQHDEKNLTLEMRKNKRGARIFVDYLRNGFGATAVAPYAVRPHEKAPVATPLEWHEVKNSKLSSQQYTIKTIHKRIAKMGDPWEHMMKQASSLKAARKKLDGMI